MPYHKAEHRYFIADFFVIVLLGLLSFHFIMVAFQGEFSYFQRVQIENEEQGLMRELQNYQIQRVALENRVLRLSDDYLDLDLLDERARKILGMARLDDVMLYQD